MLITNKHQVDVSYKHPSLLFGIIFRSTDAEDIVRLQPAHTDYIAMCGNKLEFQITPGSEQQVNKTRDQFQKVVCTLL
jgi:hypothetical protein